MRFGRRRRAQAPERARPCRLAVGRSRRRRRPRVDRPLHQARQGAAAPRRRRAEGRHLGAGHRPGRDRRPRRQRRLLRPRAAPHHLERLVHDELRRAAGQGPQRRVGDRVGVHDDDPRVHERPADPRPPAQRPPARAGGCDQPDPDVDGRRQGDRPRDPRAAGQGGRHLRARPGPGRLDRRSRRHARRRGDDRRGERALPRGSRHGPVRGHPPLHGRAARLLGRRRQLLLLDLRQRADDGAREHGQGLRLVRQRVGLQLSAGRPRRSGSRHIAAAAFRP